MRKLSISCLTYIILLKGNHEFLAIESVQPESGSMNSSTYDTWESNGGPNTIKSFGDWEKTSKGIKALIPYLKMYHMNEEEKIIYVHADLPGNAKINNKEDMEKLITDESGVVIKPRDYLLWSRDFSWKGDFKVIVGHTIVQAVEKLNNYVKVDTGAFDSGILCAYDALNDKIYKVKGEKIDWYDRDMRGYA